jgi:hypothetical protein
METSPRQMLRLAPRESPPDPNQGNGSQAHGHLCFSLGRGGFSARAEEPLGLGKVNFLCLFPEDSQNGHHDDSIPELAGHGYVRWRSRLDQTVGVEFAFIESPGREWVVKRLAETNPRPFIPALHLPDDCP